MGQLQHHSILWLATGNTLQHWQVWEHHVKWNDWTLFTVQSTSTHTHTHTHTQLSRVVVHPLDLRMFVLCMTKLKALWFVSPEKTRQSETGFTLTHFGFLFGFCSLLAFVCSLIRVSGRSVLLVSRWSSFSYSGCDLIITSVNKSSSKQLCFLDTQYNSVMPHSFVVD